MPLLMQVTHFFHQEEYESRFPEAVQYLTEGLEDSLQLYHLTLLFYGGCPFLPFL